MLTIVQLVWTERARIGAAAAGATTRWRPQLPHVEALICLGLLDLYHLPLYQLVQSDRVTTALEVLAFVLFNEHFGKCFSSEQVAYALETAVCSNRLDAMKKLLEYAAMYQPNHGFLTTVACQAATACGRVEIIKWLWDHRQRQCVPLRSTFADHVEDVAGFRFLLENGLIDDVQQAVVAAACQKRVEIVRFAHANKLICCAQCVLEAALMVGDMAIVELLQTTLFTTKCCYGKQHVLPRHATQSDTFIDTECFMAKVVQHGRLAGLKWVLDRFPMAEVSGNMLIWSASAGDLGVFEWVYGRLSQVGGCPEWVFGVAMGEASCTSAEIIRFLMDHGRGTSLASVRGWLEDGPCDLRTYVKQNFGFNCWCSIAITSVVERLEWDCAEHREVLWEICCGCEKSRRFLTAKAACCRNGRTLLEYSGIKARPAEEQIIALTLAMSCDSIESAMYLLEDASTELVATLNQTFQSHKPAMGVSALYSCSGKELVRNVVKAAAHHKDLSIIQCLIDYKITGFTSRAMDWAAASGSIEIVQLLHHSGFGCTTAAMDQAAANGHLEVVRFLHDHRSEGCTTSAMDTASSNGHLNVVQFLHQYRREGCTTQAMDNAAQRGSLEMVKFLHQHRREGCTTEAMDAAAESGYLSIVRYLHENRHEGCTTRALACAVRCGHLHVVRFLHENREEGCIANAMNLAAGSGHVHVVKYLHQQQTDRSSIKAVCAAAECGHLSVVKYFCNGDNSNTHAQCALEVACQVGVWNVLQWLVANVPEMNFNRALVSARTAHDLKGDREVSLIVAYLENRLVDLYGAHRDGDHRQTI